MGLYKRNGTWCVQYFAHGKRVREAIGPSKRQAELVLAKRKADIREGRYFAPTERPLAFSVLLDRYLREYVAVHRKPRSYLRYVAAAKVLTGYFGEKLVKNVRPEDVHAFILHRRERGKSGATINGELAVLSSAYTWANKLKLTTHHPCRGIGRLKANRKDRYLSQEEIQYLLTAISGDLHDTAIVALGTGMRASEVLTLDRDHVNLTQAVAVLPDTKNGDHRAVPLPPPVVVMFQQRPLPLREWFPGLTYKRLSEQFSRAAKKAGLPGVTFHTLRHTFASYAAMNGVDLYTLAKLLGHRDLAQVQRYAHLSRSHLQTAANQAATAIFAEHVPHQVPHATGKVA
jgi:integrase